MVCQFLGCPLSQDLDEMCVYIGWVVEVLMDHLTMLSRREQLMEDIDAIVDEFTFDLPIDDIHERSQLAEDLTRVLCDAVCKNFPTKWEQCNS